MRTTLLVALTGIVFIAALLAILSTTATITTEVAWQVGQKASTIILILMVASLLVTALLKARR